MNNMDRSLDRKKVILGLSGGVDSTTAALLLLEKGYQVTGLYFDVEQPENKEGAAAARRAAEQLGIPFLYRNIHEVFEKTVIHNICQEYQCGRTPNPCVVCNPAVKFRTLIEAADREGAFYIATGHYARTTRHDQLGWSIRKGESEKKDQSYMLYRLSSSIIERLLLPLGILHSKEEARAAAREKNLFNADQKDSQEICFLPEGETYADYLLKRGVNPKPGNFIDKDGHILGQHQGLVRYTIGQRKGLGITFGKPVFVIRMDPENNTITLGDNEDLFSREVICGNSFFPNSASGQLPDFLENAEVTAKIRYAAKPASARLHTLPDGRISAVFDEKQRAATPGQSIVFYYGDCVAGGGFIE